MTAAWSNVIRPLDTAAKMAVSLVSGLISKMDPGAGRRTSCMTAWRCAREKIRRKRAEITLVRVSPAATAVATPATAAAFATGMSMVGHLPSVS